MKRLFLSVLTALSAVGTFAGNESSDNASKLDSYRLEVNNWKLAHTLSLDNSQIAGITQAHDELSKEMRRASFASDGNRKEMLDEALRKDALYVKKLLSRRQYQQYLMILNATMQNRGLR